jgi:hypothetical protein
VYDPPPRGVDEEIFSYSFDSTNTPGLNQNVPANSVVNNIPLTYQADSAFLARAIGVQVVNLSIQFRDAFGRILSDDYVPLNDSYQRSSIPSDGPAGQIFIPIEPELLITPRGTWLVYLLNGTGAPIACPKITLYGVKRWKA